MKPFAVIIFGSPGSGKSTQADLIAEKYGLVHFNTGKYVERFIYDPATKNSKIAQKTRNEFETGKLVEPRIILDIVEKQVRNLFGQHESVVFSGSPRTEYEAFGAESKKGVMDILANLYGKNRILIFKLVIPQKEAIERNKKRIVCSVCNTPLMGAALNLKIKACPFCGGKLYRRTLDTEEVIRKRFKEYESRTFPIFSKLQKMNYHIHQISATPLPYKIFANITKKIDSLLK